jgi:hypothetical protein
LDLNTSQKEKGHRHWPILSHTLEPPLFRPPSSPPCVCVCVCVYTIDVTCLALRQNLCQSSRWVSVFCPSRDSSHTTHDDDNSFVFSFSDKSKDEWEGPTKSLIKFHRCCCSAAGVAKRLNQQNINFFFCSVQSRNPRVHCISALCDVSSSVGACL